MDWIEAYWWHKPRKQKLQGKKRTPVLAKDTLYITSNTVQSESKNTLRHYAASGVASSFLASSGLASVLASSGLASSFFDSTGAASFISTSFLAASSGFFTSAFGEASTFFSFASTSTYGGLASMVWRHFIALKSSASAPSFSIQKQRLSPWELLATLIPTIPLLFSSPFG